MIALSVDADVVSIVSPAAAIVAGVTDATRVQALEEALAEAERRLRTMDPTASPLANVRAMYRRFGVDPTKTRPSSEALLRRIRKGEPLPRINAAVDVGNWCSVETQLPYGLYDLGRVSGSVVTLRLGREAEAYPGIRKDAVHVAGRLLLADDEGPFGNPTADSARTMVGPQTDTILVVIYCPAACADVKKAALDMTVARLLQYCGGRVTWTYGGPA